jgi:hypothetical protein
MIIVFEGSGHEFHERVTRCLIGSNIEDMSLIDLCCYTAPFTQRLPFREKTFVDVDDWDIPLSAGEFVKTDVLGSHPVFQRRFDVATCLDGIEHLAKTDGLRLVERMSMLAPRQIFFTPLGEYKVESDSDDPLVHKSGWLPEDFSGFAVIIAPNFHPTLNIGALWAWRCPDLAEDFGRVKEELA